MTPLKTAGLASAGGASRLFLARMPALLRHLGPVKGPSFRVARRLVNSLGRGRAVRDFAEFTDCQSIWISGPDTSIESAAAELAAAVDLRGKIVILCETALDSRSSGALRACGAAVATLNAMLEARERTFVAEGDATAVKYLRSVLATERRKLIEIQPEAKVLYFAGVQFAAHLLLPSIAAAVELLRAAGFSRLDATLFANALGTRALRGYGKGGRKAWNPAKAAELHRVIDRDLEALRARGSQLAALYESGIARARAFFEPDSFQP
jgi:predicted short-subunit dehydrogenase-like oxidoreductase (DUF2520 family)